MNKIFIALLTFVIGIFAFYQSKVIRTNKNISFEPIQTNNQSQHISGFNIKLNNSEIANKVSTKIQKPFFDSFEYNKNEIEPHNEIVSQSFNGWFIADKFKGMKEVRAIDLSRDRKDSGLKKPFFWNVSILTQTTNYELNEVDDFYSIQIETKKNTLKFKTNKIRGIEYKFEGEFLRNGKDFEEKELVLKGNLKKLVRGKTVAEFTSGFAYLEPICLH